MEHLNDFICVFYLSNNSSALQPIDAENVPEMSFVDYVPQPSDEENPLPHGNALGENTNPYFRRTAAVKDAIRSKLSTGKNAHSVFHDLVDESDVLGQTPCCSTPANLQQVHNVSREIRAEGGISRPSELDDQLADITTLLKAHKLWSAVFLPEQYIAFVSNDFIFEALRHSCVDGEEGFGVDTTFNTTDLWLTDTVFKCKIIIRTSDKKHPYFIGPIMFPFRKTQETFQRFATEIALVEGIENIKFVGSDLDSAIYNGFLSVFKSAKNFCVWHLKKRDEAKLREMKASATATRLVLKDIYGATLQNVKFDGLVDCTDAEEFDAILFSNKCSWESQIPGFLRLVSTSPSHYVQE